MKIGGEPVNYYWNPLNNMAGLLPWLILAAAFVFFKENRSRQAFWILVPVLIVKGLWAALAAAFSISSSESVLFAAMLDTLLISFALVWMLAERLGRFNRFVRLLLETVVLCVVGAASISRVGLGTEPILVAVLCIVTWSIVLSAYSFGRFMCRKRFGAIRFSVWAAAWILVTTPLLFTMVAAVQMHNVEYLKQFIMEVLAVALIFAGIAVGGLVPFEILLLANSFWRKRFERLFGTRTKPLTKDVADQMAEAPLMQ